MNKFEVTILGCGSATPTFMHLPTCQVVNVREKLFMIDCGEGAQLQFRKAHLSFNRLGHIFISHLHGDHCFGLIGLISTFGLLGRTNSLTIHAIADLESIIRPQLNYFCPFLPFEVHFQSFDPLSHQIIYQDRSVTISTIPLKHSLPCAGFLFEEAQNDLHLDGEAIRFFNVPIRELQFIKKGADFMTEEGTVIPNARLTKPADIARKYAFCSDTAYNEAIIPIIKDVDLLYHESTFLEEHSVRSKKTGHSTAKQAATIAKLAGVKKLMLGHFSSRYTNDFDFIAEAKPIFSNVTTANELLVEKL